MENKGLVHEVFWLRCIACIAVTFGHGLQIGYEQYTDATQYHIVSYLLYMAVLFGVPVFVFISEFLLSNKYSLKVPSGFIKKRIKILVIPYIFMSIVYAFLDADTLNAENVFVEATKNIFLGHSTVYFVIIIFQFYVLHILSRRYLNQWSPKKVIPIALLVNIAYLSAFNFSEAPNHPFAVYFWDIGYYLFFVSWIFYFVLGYYCGKYYQSTLNFLRRYNKIIYLMPVITFGMILVMNKVFLLTQSSKRVDMLLFATSMIFLIMYVSSNFRNTPKIIMLISNYSFSIFLLNEFFFLIMLPIQPPAFLNILTYSIVAFFLSLVCSIIVAYLLNRFTFGKYLVGQTMKFKVRKVPKIKQSA
ncbi:adhesin [Robertmurraya yapensis]|uniref:Adhesin n=2 Tax=Bacillaceae TaxID=186817 RepID=A0A3S0KGH9_9BACI|nr:acyltransferase family protein [Bacillus yapensis]RTR30014.1 adhesin [Bacillus yapensis]TKS95095.1 adhesin [Bacillus yapensis]